MNGRRLKKHAGAINSPKHPSNQGGRHFSNFLLSAWSLYTFFSLPNTKKHIHPLDSSIFTNNTRYCSYTQSSFPWFYTLDLGFRGVGVTFLTIIHTPNLLNLFLAFILLFLLEQHDLLLSFSMLLALFVFLA